MNLCKMKQALCCLLIVFNLAGLAEQSFSPIKEALRLFNKYKPTIERNNDAIIDKPRIMQGDINNDSLSDCIIFFVMTSRKGGNAIVGKEAAIYINTGKKMKVVGPFQNLTSAMWLTGPGIKSFTWRNINANLLIMNLSGSENRYTAMG